MNTHTALIRPMTKSLPQRKPQYLVLKRNSRKIQFKFWNPVDACRKAFALGSKEWKAINIEGRELGMFDVDDPTSLQVSRYKRTHLKQVESKHGHVVHPETGAVIVRGAPMSYGNLLPDDARHGKASSYTHYKCRCPACVIAMYDFTHGDDMEPAKTCGVKGTRRARNTVHTKTPVPVLGDPAVAKAYVSKREYHTPSFVPLDEPIMDAPPVVETPPVPVLGVVSSSEVKPLLNHADMLCGIRQRMLSKPPNTVAAAIPAVAATSTPTATALLTKSDSGYSLTVELRGVARCDSVTIKYLDGETK